MRKTISLLILGIGLLLLTACGTSNAEADRQQGDNTNGSGSGNGIVAGEIVASLIESSSFQFEYQLSNQTEQEVTMDFTSSQRYDYSVETADGEQLYLYSSVASFMQVIGEEKIKQGEALQYEIDLSDLNLTPGEYVLTAWMTPQDGEQFPAEHEFTVE